MENDAPKPAVTGATPADPVDRDLDDAVADSFPASDPVSLSQPHDPRELRSRRGASPMTMILGGLVAVLVLLSLRS